MNLSPSIQNKSKLLSPILAGFGHIGTATHVRNYEDRFFCETIVTQAGITLTLAIVSDGVGGGQLGQRAAQLTVDSIVDYIRSSDEGDVPALLGKAIGSANRNVYKEGALYDDRKTMSATVAVAAICGNKLFIANVGDSRVYLIRNGKQVIQLTLDHTWALERIREGKLSKQEAYRHPSAGALTRSVGYYESVQVDLGIYLSEVDVDYKTAFSRQGMSLRSDDVILVCSDGLIKQTHSGQGHYVENDEIVDTVNRFLPEKAVRDLIDLAVERNVDDNVTAVIVEFPGRKRSRVQLPRLKLTKIAFWMILISLLGFIGLGFLVIPQIVPEPPPPTPQPGYTYLINGKLDHKFGTNEFSPHHKGSSFPFFAGSILRISEGVVELNLPGGFRVLSTGASDAPSLLELLQESSTGAFEETILVLKDGSLILIDDNPGDNSVEVVIETQAGLASLSGRVMGIRYSSLNSLMEVDCIVGTCTVETEAYPVLLLQNGERTIILVSEAPTPISPVRLELYTSYDLSDLLPSEE